MRLSECLNSSDIDTLRKIAEVYGFDCHRSSKNSLMQSIICHFNNRKFVYERLSQIDSPEYREALIQLAMDRRPCFSREELGAVVKRAAGNGEKPEERVISNLLRDGWMYRLGGQGGRTVYYMPEDLLKTIGDFVSAELQIRVETVDHTPLVYRDDQFAIVRDAMQFFSFIKNHEVKLTQDGVIFKRQLVLLLNSLEIKEEPPAGGWRFGYGRRFYNYPDRFAFLYDYCYARGLIEECETGILNLTGRVDAWLEKTDEGKLSDMVKYWRFLYRRPIPRLSLAVSLLARAAGKKWTLAESLNRLLSRYVTDYYYDSQAQVMEKRIYRMMVNLGLLCCGKMADGRDVVKLSALGRLLLLEETVREEQESEPDGPTPLIVQPNFDVLLPAGEAGRLGWEVSQFADLVRPDAMRIYRITKNSVLRGLQNGWTGPEMTGFLDRHSGAALPDNVKRMIERWSGEFTTIQK